MNKILWSTLVQIIGKGAQIFLGLLAVKLLTSTLGPENYGVYGKISEYTLFFATVANLGIFGNIVRKISENPKDGLLIGNALILRLFTALFFFGIGIAYALLFIQDSLFLTGTLLFMASLLLDYLTSVCDAVLQAHYRMGRATIALIAGRGLNLGMLVLLSQSEWSTATYFLAPLAGAGLTLSLTWFFVQKTLSIKWALQQNLLKSLLWTSLPFGIINLLNTLYYRFIPSALLSKKLTDEVYGLYDLSLSIATIVSLLSTLFMFSVLPQLKAHIEANALEQTKKLVQRAKQLLSLGAIGVIAFGTWLAPVALSLVSSKDFLDPSYGFILPLLLVLAGVSYFYDLAFITLFAFNKDVLWMKKEAWVASFSILLFASAFYAPVTTPLQTALVLTGAIVAEATMALWGMRKVKSLLKVDTKS